MSSLRKSNSNSSFCLLLKLNVIYTIYIFFQLSHIPGKKFWASLPNLSMVFMHNNGFAHLEEVKYISHSPSLCTLTLYDSPISLKKNYRHCVVNAVWTLKALDNYVISDEEIIEDAHFTDVFKPLRKQFCYRSNFCTNNQKVKFVVFIFL